MVEDLSADPQGDRVVPGEPCWLRMIAQTSRMLNRIAAIFAAVLLVLMVLLILTEITLRFFSMSTFMADALVGRGVAAITFLAMAWTLEKGSMIRIQVLTSRLTGVVKKAMSLITLLVTEIFLCWMISFQYPITVRLFLQGRTSETYFPLPLWIQNGFFLTGLVLTALTLLIAFLRLAVTGVDDHDNPLHI